jgi:hypothetical protein
MVVDRSEPHQLLQKFNAAQPRLRRTPLQPATAGGLWCNIGADAICAGDEAMTGRRRAVGALNRSDP